MDRSRGAVYAVVAVVAVVTLLSGPLVGAVDLTTEPDDGLGSNAGQGNATVTVTDFPEEVTISKGRYGAQKYYLRVPEAKVDVSDIEGKPFLVYDVTVEELYFGTTTTTFLDESAEGTHSLSIEQQAFEPGEIDRDRYNVTVSILLRGSGNETVIRSERFVAEVQR